MKALKDAQHELERRAELYPELLDALKELVAKNNCNYDRNTTSYSVTMDIARAIIAKCEKEDKP